jgi:hypothetical protein
MSQQHESVLITHHQTSELAIILDHLNPFGEGSDGVNCLSLDGVALMQAKFLPQHGLNISLFYFQSLLPTTPLLPSVAYARRFEMILS